MNNHLLRKTIYKSIALSISLAVWLVLGQMVQATGTQVSLEAYWQMLTKMRDTVRQLEQQTRTEQEATLNILATDLAQVTFVTLPSKTSMPVDHSFLIAEMKQTPPDIVRLVALLDTLLSQRQAWISGVHHAADIAPLNQLLARNEFQWVVEEPSVVVQMWRRFMDFLRDLFLWLVPSNTIIATPGSGISYLVTGFGALILVAAFFFVFRELLTDFVAQAEFDPGAEADGEPLTSETALARANTLSNSGDYRTAIRYLYLSSLLHLDERGLLRYDRARTNREYLRSVADTPQLATILHEVIDIFDRTWYGFQTVDEPTYARYAARVAELGSAKKVTPTE